eukprot:4161593-Amphidinium_carterae.1
MPEASPIVAYDALRKWHPFAPSDSACMTLWFGSFTLVSQVCGQVKFNINSALPLLWWDRVTPSDSSIVLGTIKSISLIRTIIWSKDTSLCKDGPSFSCPSLDKS